MLSNDNSNILQGKQLDLTTQSNINKVFKKLKFVSIND